MTGKSPVGAFKSLCKPNKRGWLRLRRLDQRHHPDPDRAVLLGHRRLGHQISGRIIVARPEPARWPRTAIFSGFISNGVSAEVCFVVFAAADAGASSSRACANGVERVSKVMMPVLVVLSVIIAVYSVTRPGALAGVKYFLVPNLAQLLLDDGGHGHGADVLLAVHRHGHPGHLRFLYEKGHLHRGVDRRMWRCSTRPSPIMAGLMIIPAVFAFSGGDPDTLQAGPALMFITHPQGVRQHGPGHARWACCSFCWCCLRR